MKRPRKAAAGRARSLIFSNRRLRIWK